MEKYEKCYNLKCIGNFSGECRQLFLRCKERLFNSELRKSYMLRIKEHSKEQFLKEYDYKFYK